MTEVENQAPNPELRRAELLQKARSISTLPGVYLMKDESGGILYVGKAKNLRNRVSSYFQAARHERLRTELLVTAIYAFDLILTETENEALILECTLIKKHKPRFNVRLKDDKGYPYLKMDVAQAFPRLEWTRRVKRDGARYFGPFPSAWSARQTLQLLNHTFRLRDCSDNTFRHRSRPCILYQIDQCSGPCVRLTDEAGYRKSIDQAMSILEGKADELLGSLRGQMNEAAIAEEFERAAHFRDQIQALEGITSIQGVVEAGSDRDRDVIGIARSELVFHAVILQIRGGRLISVRHFDVQNADPILSDSEILGGVLTQYYVALDSKPDLSQAGGEGLSRPSEVLIPVPPENSEFEMLESSLGLRIRTSESPLDEQILGVARQNAKYSVEQNAKHSGGHGLAALEEVQEKLELSKLPHRIECFDNSNIHGEDAVASRVVFVDGAPDKNLYRRYKIKTVEGANDFATMREVLGRRFAALGREGDELPDLVVVDGGKGQLSQAVAILEELQIQGVAVVGLAKARTESDFRSTELKSSLERIFIPGRKNPVNLLPHMPAYKLLTHVRDEAHRFAISYHRQVRDKRVLGKKKDSS
ncbi:MAG: excinuclease ABC subunit UvrC [Bdellovibrionales bacterium]|nr:excinuclease ABC subunit UvrC [Bdellovibrionales bacterium]